MKMYETRTIEFALYKKQVLLCSKHYLAINTGQLFLEDLATNFRSFKLLNSERREIHF
jgi:hypothetical protein